MSMLSAQIDKLRKAAEYYDNSEVASIMRYAADTIWQLRDDLQQANAENDRLRTQLADVTESMGRVEERCVKLRELCADMLHDAMENICSKAYWCGENSWQTCNDEECDNRLYVEMVCDLRVEVDESDS